VKNAFQFHDVWWDSFGREVPSFTDMKMEQPRETLVIQWCYARTTLGHPRRLGRGPEEDEMKSSPTVHLMSITFKNGQSSYISACGVKKGSMASGIRNTTCPKCLGKLSPAK